MQAIILAGGVGKRLQPLTLSTPKPLIEVAGRPILHHIFETLPQEVDEVILVIGYLGYKIRNSIGDSYLERRVRYIEQPEALGTAHAVGLCRPYLRGKFLLRYGDDIHTKESIEKCVRHNLAISVSEVEDPSRFGVVKIRDDGSLESIVEKPKENAPSNLASNGILVLDERIFDYEAILHENGEHYIVDQLLQLAQDHTVMVERADTWIPVAYPEDLKLLEEYLLNLESSA